MSTNQLNIKIGQILKGSIFDEPMKVETVVQSGKEIWTFGLIGIKSERFRRVILTLKDSIL